MSEAVEHELQQLLAAHTQEEAQLHSLRLLSQYIQQSSTGEELPDLEESKEEEEEDNGMWATPFNNGEKNGQVKYLINHIENGSHLSNGNGHADLPFSLLHHKHLPQFMWYVLNQCFGWKESGETRTQKDGRIHKEVAVKPQLISILDDFIKWFQSHDVGEEMLRGYIYCLEEAVQKPLVRKQVLNLATDWLKMQDLEEVEEPIYPLIKTLLLSGLQDVWSAIRSLVSSRLAPIIDAFSLSQLQDFFNDLVQICLSTESTWQAKEGCIMALNSAVRRFQWVGVDPGDLQRITESQRDTLEVQSPRTQYFLKFGQEELPGLPLFITSQMKSTVFFLLAHPQLTVRENATKAFSSYLSRCEFKEALVGFKDIVRQLCRDTKYNGSELPGKQDMPHLAVLDPTFKFMDAYEAEGLLAVCVCLVKHIPPGFLLPNWPVYFSAFCLYLMHPASTVRQVASDIFKFLVAKDSHNPLILKLVLEGLTANWHVSVNGLAMPCNRAVNPALQQLAASTAHNGIGGMFASNQSRTCIASVASSKRGQYLLPEAWEWREGRLFAYEVILQFVIKNHIIYTFGSLSTTPNQGMDLANSSLPLPNSSSDEVFYPRKRRRSQDVSSQDTAETLGFLKNSLHRTFSEKNRQGTATNPSTPTPSPHRHSLANGFAPIDVNSDDCDTYTAEEDMYNRLRRVTGSQFARPRNSIATYIPSREMLPTKQYGDRSAAQNADSPTAKLMAKLPTVAGFNSPSLRTLVKHYSYFTQNSVPFSAPTVSLMMGKTASLLMHTLALDLQQQKDNKPVNSPRYEGPLQPDKEKLRSCLCPSPIGDMEEPSWLETVDICSLADILKAILYQSIESIADTQWELRRMGQQLLPCVVEVIRWYDMKILEDLWLEHLRPTTSLMCYGACLALKYSMDHAARLQPMLENPPHTWQDPELCRQVVLRIISLLGERLPQLTTVMHGLLLRPCYDRMTALAMEILMMAHVYFKLPPAQQAVQVGCIVSVLKEVFVTAHPDSALVAHFKEPRRRPLEFLTPLEGFLSCIPLQADGVQSAARQVEKSLCSSIHTLLSPFLVHCDLRDVCQLLPILAVYVGHYADMDTFHRSLVDSLASAVSSSVQTKKRSNGLRLPEVSKCLVFTLQELANVIGHTSLEVTTLRQVLDIYVTLSLVVPAERHLVAILTAVTSKLNTASPSRPSLALYQRGTSSSTQLSSPPDVSIVPHQDSQNSETDEDEIDLPSQGMAESHMLNISNLSGSTRTSGRLSTSVDGRPTSLISEEEGEESDWDSWDEEEDEEDQECMRQIFVEFLEKLRSQYTSRSIDRSRSRSLDSSMSEERASSAGSSRTDDSFEACLKQLTVRDRKIIEGLR